ncbi:MAG TPA: lysylphosphatidylglycerol synthase transmembrane domain-containing protein [Vicinamibacterales bacterium]|jgi:uncharacterized protein (TIRG00374 family)|nr:lysylphosphatidylglycerol synthase transmembrane domain-containing protein [Vicinamibacterales bacterium]
MTRTWVRVAIAAVALAAFAVVLIRVNVGSVLAAIGTMSWGWAIAAALANLLTVVVDAARWRVLVLPISRPSLLRATQALLLGFLGNLVLPYKLGDGARAVALARWQELPIATVAATVVLDRLVDAATFVLATMVMTVAFEAQTPVKAPARLGIVVIAILATLAGGTWWMRRRSKGDRAGGHAAIKRFAAHILDGLRALREGRLLPAVAALAVLAWIGRTSVIWCMLQAFHLRLPLLAAIGTLIAINVGISVVAAPANAGVYEMSTAGALAAWGVPPAIGVSCGLAMHAAEVIPILLLGLAVLLTTGVRLTGSVD